MRKQGPLEEPRHSGRRCYQFLSCLAVPASPCFSSRRSKRICSCTRAALDRAWAVRSLFPLAPASLHPPHGHGSLLLITIVSYGVDEIKKALYASVEHKLDARNGTLATLPLHPPLPSSCAIHTRVRLRDHHCRNGEHRLWHCARGRPCQSASLVHLVVAPPGLHVTLSVLLYC